MSTTTAIRHQNSIVLVVLFAFLATSQTTILEAYSWMFHHHQHTTPQQRRPLPALWSTSISSSSSSSSSPSPPLPQSPSSSSSGSQPTMEEADDKDDGVGNNTQDDDDDDDVKPVENSRQKKAFPQQTPHSGRHFYPSHPFYTKKKRSMLHRWRRPKRFTEGWYYRLTLVEEGVSFAFIMSIEDPGRTKSDLRMACIQIDGPNEEYLVQADRDDTKFWAWKDQQGLGCVFEHNDNDHRKSDNTRNNPALSPNEFRETVKSGFQVLPTRLLGKIDGHDGSRGGILPGMGNPMACDYDIRIAPLAGWGGSGNGNDEQRSTAGWLASFPVFEPHWQVTMADATASGCVNWNGRVYRFENEPFYAEKNWGQSLPLKWFWTQCNSFDGFRNNLTVTAGGGIRKVPFGQRETLGMVSVHHNGTFYEAVPWTGDMNWTVSAWGSWNLTGRCTFGERPFEVEILYELDPDATKGLVFRAPTPDEGMVKHCRNTFDAGVTLSLWELERDGKRHYRRAHPPVLDRVRSSQGGAEIGGAPWWDTWEVRSTMKRPIKRLLQIPYRIDHFRKKRRQRRKQQQQKRQHKQ